MLHWEDFPQVSEAKMICHQINLEKALSNDELLKSIFNDTLHDIGITSSQGINNGIFIRNYGAMILRYAEDGRINKKKTLILINKYGSERACEILGCTALCFMERWGIISGPKIP